MKEAQNQYTRAVQHCEKMQEDLDRLELENLSLKVKKASRKNWTCSETPVKYQFDTSNRSTGQEHSEQLRDSNNASVTNQMEDRIQNLESELHKMKI